MGDIKEVIEKADKLAKDVATRREESKTGKVRSLSLFSLQLFWLVSHSHSCLVA